MQLLQKLRDSASLEKIVREVAEVEVEAKRFIKEIIDFLNQSRGGLLLFTYTGFGYVPASLMYWYSLTFQSSKHPIIGDAEEVSIYLAPYRDDVSTLIFSTGEYSKLITALQVVKILDIDYKAFAPQPSQENLKSILKYYGVTTLPYNDKFKVALSLTLSSFLALSETYKNSLSSRGKRLFIHGSDGFAITIESFIEKYFPVIEKIVGLREIIITSTRFLEASSILLAQALRQLGLRARYMPIEETINSNTPVLFVALSTEDRIRKEYVASLHKPTFELILNIDPLEAAVYLTILAFIITRSL